MTIKILRKKLAKSGRCVHACVHTHACAQTHIMLLSNIEENK